MRLKTRTVIEITDTHIKLLQARKEKGELAVSAVDWCSIEGKSDVEIQQNVLALIRPYVIDPDDFILVLPRRLCAVKRLRLPSVIDREIHKMMPLQVKNIMPHALEDLVYGYEVLEREPTGHTKLIVYVLHINVCRKFFGIFKQAKVAPSRFFLSSAGITQWFFHNKINPPSGAPVLVINLDLTHTEICFLNGDRLLFSRVLDYGLKDLRSDHHEVFFDQVALTIKMYRKESFGNDIDRIVMVSSMEETRAVADTLKGLSGLPVEIVSSDAAVTIHEPSLLDRMKSCRGLSFTVCLGLVLSRQESVNLIAKDIRDSKEVQRKNVHIRYFIALATVALLLVALIVGSEGFVKAGIIRDIENRRRELKPEVTRAKEKVELVNGIDAAISKRVIVSDLMVRLYKVAPTGLSFSSMALTKSGDMIISGFATSGSAVNAFQSKLAQSRDFSNVALQFSSKRMLYDQEVIEFKITFMLKRGHDTNID